MFRSFYDVTIGCRASPWLIIVITIVCSFCPTHTHIHIHTHFHIHIHRILCAEGISERQQLRESTASLASLALLAVRSQPSRIGEGQMANSSRSRRYISLIGDRWWRLVTMTMATTWSYPTRCSTMGIPPGGLCGLCAFRFATIRHDSQCQPPIWLSCLTNPTNPTNPL